MSGDYDALAPILAVGTHRKADPKDRLRIHRRHYETSLVTALLGKFPATVWLVGSQFIAEAARQYVCTRPPQRPCIAEYGADFPDFIAGLPCSEHLPYLGHFARLECQVGYVAIAVDQPAIAREALAAIPAERVANTVLGLQPGLQYLSASWPVDDLFKVYLSEAAPERLEFDPEQVWIEVRGARGEFRLERLTQAEFTFRAALTERRSIGDALEGALAIDSSLDAGRSLATLFGSGLVTAIEPNDQEAQ